jgi:DNA-directed RNA polymerase subunit RPC12/RpoP
MIHFACPRCGMQMSAPEDCAGRPTKCRQCGQSVTVPGSPPDLKPGADCPSCHSPLLIPKGAFGQWFQCPKCGVRFTPRMESPPPLPPTAFGLQSSAGQSVVNFTCPSCKTACTHTTPGEKVLCPKCGQKILVPTPPAPPPNKTVLGSWEPAASSASSPAVRASTVPAPSSQPVPVPPPADLFAFTEPRGSRYSTPDRPHSQLGIASTVIAFLVGGLDLILGIVVVVGIARSSPSRGDLQVNILSGGIAMVRLNCLERLAHGLHTDRIGWLLGPPTGYHHASALQ